MTAGAVRQALFVAPDVDLAPIWLAPIINVHPPATIAAEELELWVNSIDGGVAPVPYWRLCDHINDNNLELCDNQSVALVVIDNVAWWAPRCLAHLPPDTVPLDSDPVWHIVTIHPDVDAHIEQLATAILSTFAFCETQSQASDVADLLATALQAAARTVGGAEALIAHRPGSWEAAHVVGLAAGAGW